MDGNKLIVSWHIFYDAISVMICSYMISADMLVTYIVQAAFILLGLWSLIDYVRFRDPIRRDIALMFASLAAATLINLINEWLGPVMPSLIGSLLLVAQPYLLLRLVRYFHPVPFWVNVAAIIGLAGSYLIIIFSGSNLQIVFILAVVVYFVLVNGYAMVSFIKRASDTYGITHKRLRFTALGSGLLALALGFIGLNALFPDWALLLSRLIQAAALGSALTFYLGLAPPYWLRQTWQFQELRHFQSQLSHPPTAVFEMYNMLCEAAQNATGGNQAVIVYPDSQDSEVWRLHHPHRSGRDCPGLKHDHIFARQGTAVTIHTEAFTPAERACLPPDTADFIYLVPLAREGTHWGCLLVMLEHGSLFAEDDLELLRNFAQQSSIILQNLELIEKLNRHANLLEEQVQQRTAELAQKNTQIKLLQEVTVAANEADSLDEPLREAISLICEAIDLPIGHAYAPAESDSLKLISKPIWYLKEPARYEPFRTVTEKTPFSFSLGGVGQVAAEGKPLWLQNLTQQPNFVRAKVAEAVGIQTGIFIPVFVADEIMAVLEFFSDKAIPRDETVLNLLLNIGTQLGRVIERKKTELTIRHSEARFRALMASAPAGIVIINSVGNIVMVNDTAATMFGYQRAELVDEKLEMLLPQRLHTVHQQHRQGYFENPRARPMGVGYDLIGRRQDGTVFPIEVGLSTITTFEGTLAVGFITDISERKRIEEALQQLNQELEKRVAERTEHLAAVNKELESFSYSVSHDLRAPLRAIDGFSLALLEDYHAILDDEGKEFLELIRSESQAMGQLIDDLLDLSRYTRADIKRETINLSKMAKQIADSLQKQEPERQATIAIEEGLTLFGDRNLIQVVIQNLLDNAWKYTSKQAVVQISLGKVEQNGESIYFVQDNGVGFNMAYAHKMFGTFQRLHSAREFAGTGIGLATVQRIIHRHGGRIWAEGTENEGATFYFTLGTGVATE